jgi:hypothetical protein
MDRSRSRRLTASLTLALVACAGAGPAADAKRAPAPLKPPSISAKLITADPIAVLQTGRFAVRVTARRTASVRLAAFSSTAPIAPPKTIRFRARKSRSRTFDLALSDGARRKLNSCASTIITLLVQARGYGSPGLKTKRHTKLTRRRFAFVCRGGKLVAQTPADAGLGRPDRGLPVAATPQQSAAQAKGGGGSPTEGGGGSGPGSGSGGNTPAAAPRYEVGIGAQSLAPDADGKWKGKPVYLGGFGFGGGPAVPDPTGQLRGRPATGVLGEGPSVRAFVVGDGKNTSAVADMEVQGWFTERRSDTNGIIDMRKAVAKATAGALPATRVIIQSDHTHSGADALGVWGGVPADFIVYMRKQTETAILTAWFNRAPGRLYYGFAEGKDLLTNQFSYDESNKSQDSEVRVLQARDEDGTPFATLLNFSAHSTVLGAGNTLISGDWEQAANRIMSERKTADGKPVFGEPMTMVGTFGRTQPNRGNPCTDLPKDSGPQSLCKINDYAGQVVARAETALASATPITGAPVVGGSSYLIQDPATNAPILGFATVGPTGGSIAGLPFNRSSEPPWQAGNVLGTVTGTLRIGDVLLSSVPGEIYPQIALAVRDTVKNIRPHGFMTAGLADDQLGYIIAPFEAYPAPVQATFVSANEGDEILGCAMKPGPNCSSVVKPLPNDNYFFNVSHTLGERVICSLLRGADDQFKTGYRGSAQRCNLFPNDLAMGPGADVDLSDKIPAVPQP